LPRDGDGRAGVDERQDLDAAKTRRRGEPGSLPLVSGKVSTGKATALTFANGKLQKRAFFCRLPTLPASSVRSSVGTAQL
jgi:hypothetical protein